MTFSILLRDPQTGDIGVAICSSSPAVAARCINLADGVGASSSQNVTDPRLGPALLERLSLGDSAQQAIDSVVSLADPDTIQYRQLMVLDRQGRAAAFSGRNALGTFGSVIRSDAVAGGNMLASLDVLKAMADVALSAEGNLEQRLIASLQAAIAAGGEEGPVHSSGISVVRDVGWRITDLRVDWSEDPVGELGRLLDVWLPQRDDYVTRGISPSVAPSYGVAGDQ